MGDWHLPPGGLLPSLAVVVISAKLLSASILHPHSQTHTSAGLSQGSAGSPWGRYVVTHTPGHGVVVGSPYLLSVDVTSHSEDLLWPLACWCNGDGLRLQELVYLISLLSDMSNFFVFTVLKVSLDVHECKWRWCKTVIKSLKMDDNFLFFLHHFHIQQLIVIAISEIDFLKKKTDVDVCWGNI